MSKTSVEQLYGEIWADDSPLKAELEQSLDPRGTDWLFEAFAERGPQTGQLVVDVGARDARHSIRLVQEHDVRGMLAADVHVLLRSANQPAGVFVLACLGP